MNERIDVMGWMKNSDQLGSMSMNGDVRRKFVNQTNPAMEKRVDYDFFPWLVLLEDIWGGGGQQLRYMRTSVM